jgi:hypothetical protein
VSDEDNGEFGTFGPKVCVEFYITPNMAIQIEDTFLWDTEGGTANNLTLGFKILL